MSSGQSREELFDAVRAGDSDAVRRLIAAGERPDASIGYGERALGIAASRGDIEMVRCLLDLGANPDEEDYEDNTPITYALWRKQYDAIDLLLDWGTPEEQTQRAIDALMTAAANCSLRLIHRLIERGVDINSVDEDGCTALYAAMNAGHWLDEEQKAARRKIIELLLARGADVNRRFEMKWPSPKFEPVAVTLMYYAAHKNDPYIASLLRHAGGEITFTEAAAVGDLETTRLRLAAGQGPDERDVLGETALYGAALNGHTPVARLLLARGADPYALNGLGTVEEQETALFAAWYGEHLQTVSALLHAALGIDLNMSREEVGRHLGGDVGRDKLLRLLFGPKGPASERGGYNGLTPLMNAISSDKVAMANLLLAAGCDVNVSNDVGYTALMVACDSGSSVMARLLLEAGADTNRRNEQGNTPLTCAIAHGSAENLRRSEHREEKIRERQVETLDMIRLLIEYNADVNATSDYCLAPLEYAVLVGRDDMADLLRAAGAVENKGSSETKRSSLYGESA